MSPTIRDGETLTVVPVDPQEVRRGDLVLAQGTAACVAHRVVSSIKSSSPLRFILRGDSSGGGDDRSDQLYESTQILGRVTSVERGGEEIDLTSSYQTLIRWAWGIRWRIGRALNRLPQMMMLAVMLSLCSIEPAQAASSFQVGSFTKTTAGAPASQTVTHTLGVAPKAMILWTSGDTGAAFTANYHTSFGMTDGTTSKAVASSSQDSVDPSNASRRVANKVITIIQWGQVVLAEADVTSMGATTFVLNWTTNDNQAYVIHYMLIGGTDIQAKVNGFTYRTSTGNQSTAGVGFKPDLVLFSSSNSGLTGAVPVTAGSGGFTLSAMDAGGNQWASAFFITNTVSPSNTVRGQRTDSALLTVNNGPGYAKQASFVSMDAGGFTVNYSIASTLAGNVIYLALKGLNVHVGAVNKVTGGAPATQAVTGTGFRPKAVLFASYQDVSTTAAENEGRMGWGATDGTRVGSSAVVDQDIVAPTSTQSIDKTTKTFMKVDNNTPAIDAEADITSLDANGFTLNWTTNDAIATELLYVALGSLPASEVKMQDMRGSQDPTGVVSLSWETGYEVDNLGFRVYREDKGQRLLLTPALIAGSALVTGAGNALQAGHRYQWRDDRPGPGASEYWLEEIDLRGQTHWHGPIRPVPASSLTSALNSSLLQSDQGLADACSARQPVPTTDLSLSDPQALAVQRALAGQPAVKISVNQEGWYRVAQPDLLAAGLPPTADPGLLKLFRDGREVAMSVTSQGGTFGAQDAVEFYASAANTPSTDTAVYWLVASSNAGARIGLATAGTGGSTPANYPQTVEVRDHNIYFPALKNGEAEKFFGQAVTRQPTSVCVKAPNVDASAGQPAQLMVNLQGATLVDHRVSVSFNGVPQGEVVLSGQMAGGLNVPISLSLVSEAGNTVTLNSGGDTDVSLLSSVQLTYPKKYRAEQGLAKFTVAGPAFLTIPGFLHNPRAIDVTDPALPRELPVQVIPNGTDLSARLSIADSARLTVFLFEPAQALAPLSVKANPGSRWNQPDNRADLVMIATQDMLSALEPLKAQRQLEGYQGALVDIEQIYNEFSFGQKDRRAIAAFFQLATSTWNKPPKFGLLAGSASYDPRNYLGLGNFDRVPTRLVQTSDLETFSDDFAPGVAFGRFPAKTPAELAVMVAKSIKHVPLKNGSPKRVALIADQNDAFNFEGESRRLGSLFASDVSTVEVFRGTLGNEAMPGEVQNQLNAGPWLALYYGHGSQGLWAGRALTAAGAEGLISQERLGVVVSLTCLNGYFADVYSTDLATALVKAPQGGAVASWASSSLTIPEPQSGIGSEFVRQVTQGATIGEAAMVAKAASTNDDVRSTWILFGDPTLRMTPVSDQPTSHGCGCGATPGSPLLIAAAWMVVRTLSLRRFRRRSKRG